MISLLRVSAAVLISLLPLVAHAAEIKPYPRDVRVAFITSCAGGVREMIAPCRCMINQLQRTVPLEEFAGFAKMEDPTQDKRFTTAANACIGAQR